MIKAIETHYNGYRFRSRLEARWAVFFDRIGIKYEYEPEGFDLDGIWYLPDFRLYLPDMNLWVEIKPGGDVLHPDGGDLEKWCRFSDSIGELLVLCSDPWPKDLIAEKLEEQNIQGYCFVPGCRKKGIRAVHLMECPCCNGLAHFTVENIPFKALKKLKAASRTPKFMKAYRAARSARFEHGESP